MTYNDKQQEWLDTIGQYIGPEAARPIAENLFDGDHLLTDQPTELVDQLVGLGYLLRNPGGDYVTLFPFP